MKLIIGNKNYSSWSLRGWLACKQSGLAFEEILVPMYGEDWEEQRRQDGLAPSSGKVPILWDGEVVVWDSLAIMEYLADKVGRDRFWPKEDDARAMARSMAAEMHSGYLALRKQCPMNVRRRVEDAKIDDDGRADVVRILTLWAEARARFGKGGPFLFGAFTLADAMFAPVTTRFTTYGVAADAACQAYVETIAALPAYQQWYADAVAEPWTLG